MSRRNALPCGTSSSPWGVSLPRPLIASVRVIIGVQDYIPEIFQALRDREIIWHEVWGGELFEEEELSLKAVTNYWVKKRGIIKGWMH